MNNSKQGKNKLLKKILCLLAVGIVYSFTNSYATDLKVHSDGQSEQQQARITVKGTVTDTGGEPLVGVSVAVKGTTQGVLTDVNGSYSITTTSGVTLVFSYLGYTSQSKVVGAQTIIDITLVESAQTMDEVVVTALGIKKERKALGYAVSDLDSKEILKNKNPNVINSLAGKVPGVNITQNSGAAGAGATIVIRGGNSTSEGRANEPLFVIDGVIYDNSTQVIGNSATDGMTRNATTYSNRVMDINPEDIENLSVLKGAAAAALYGSRAADGAIIITTKKGAEGAVKVDFSSKMNTSWVTKLPEVQKEFGRGYYENNGVFSDMTYQSWGEKLGVGTQLYDNIGNFFQSGVVYDNNVSLAGGSKNGSFFLSASNYNQDGVVRQTAYDKTTIRFNGEQKYGHLTVGANVAYSISNTDKTLTSSGLWDGGGNGTMNAIYSWPLTEDISKYVNEDGSKYRLFDGQWDLASDKENPYWIINKNKMSDKTKRFTGALSALFKITDWWDVSARLGYDQYTTDAYSYIAPGSVVKEMYQNGRLSKSDYGYTYISTNVMSNFHKTFGDVDLNLMLGTTSEDTERLSQTHWGYNFITAGTTSFSNISKENRFFTDATSRNRLVGIYGELRASYKNILYLTVTGRNDWSSTLPLQNRSYFYPSVSASVVFTELLPKNDILTFGKIRASEAGAGKSAPAYATQTYLVSPFTYGSYTGVGNQYTSGNAFLVPELQTAWEVGTELKFLNGRLGLDWTYYHSQTKNQIASPRLSNANGYIMSSINSGSVINEGMEIALTAKPIRTKDIEWNVTLNTSYNRGRLGTFLEGVGMFYPTDAQFGTIKAASVPNGGYFLGMVGTRYAYETKEVIETVNGKEEKKQVEVEGGRYQVDPTTGLYKVSAETATVVGNREPKFIGGLNNTISYKNLTLSFLLDFRLGGDVYNGTEYYLASNGLSKLTTANGREYVNVKGVDSKTGDDVDLTYYADQNYTINGTSYSGKAMIQKYWSNYLSNSYNFITSVNWLKLRSLSVSYDFTDLIKKQNIIKRLSVTVIGTNLLTLTNYKGMDPEVSTAGGTGGSGATGIDYCSVPSTSSFSLGVNLTF
ncbi:SusC/RagA family TonB-linked outer membrane protein [Bacteroidia bacterium]|nr:SusC/RagA family TonB-linked outer membrane protein [Bacteroidia bacterium]